MKVLRKRLAAEEAGFTLTEVLVTMLMMLTVMAALHSIFSTSLRVFSFGNDKVEAVENARLGLERMEREIRGAYPVEDELLTTKEQGRISFGNDLNGECGLKVSNSGSCGDEEDSEELIEYYVNDENKLIRLNNNQYSTVIENVEEEGLEFLYLKSDGTEATTESEVQMVRITLEVNTGDSDDPITQSLTTDVTLRNRASGDA